MSATEQSVASPGTGEAQGGARVYRWRMPANWWTRNRHYFLYMLREFTAVPMALWLLWLLFEIRRAHAGAAAYYPPRSAAFIAFSVIVLLFALYHSYTFLKLAGVIIRVKLFDRPIPPRVIVLAMFATWAAASAVVAFVLIWFAR